jgi:hypothetical protein
VPKPTATRVVEQQEKVRDGWILRYRQQGTSQKQKLADKDADVEKALIQCFSVVTGRGVNISGPVLKTKPKELIKRIGLNDCKETDG